MTKLTEEERKRNQFAQADLFCYDEENLETYPSTLPSVWQVKLKLIECGESQFKSI